MFSTGGTAPWPKEPKFLDGNLLSAATGAIVAANSDLLPLSVPAGIPKRGVDFGLDAYTLDIREEDDELFVFSTEILYLRELGFTDGDVLEQGDGIMLAHEKLINEFNPPNRWINVGLDALSMQFTLP